jgi:hypothetical protein
MELLEIWSRNLDELLPALNRWPDGTTLSQFKVPSFPPAPKLAANGWRLLWDKRNLPVADISRDIKLTKALVQSLSVCDDVFFGIGVQSFETAEDVAFRDRTANFRLYCELLLFPFRWQEHAEKHGSTFCHNIHPSRLRVLPKSQTPHNGLSLRSLTSNLAFCPPTNIPVKWYSYGISPDSVGQKVCNFLLVPWPRVVYPQDFFPVGVDAKQKVGWFGYRPYSTHAGEILNFVERLLRSAEMQVGAKGVHAVVLPELALTEGLFDLLSAFLAKMGIGLISGVGSYVEPADRETPATSSDWQPSRGLAFPDTHCMNSAALSFPAAPFETDEKNLNVIQRKHHRWKLTADQIVRYGLSHQLDPTFDWWEAITVDSRSLNFVVLREWLSTCVLVCEDLARLDPIGRYVRAIGPDLVVALLMDGPQLRDRWPAYHATVLTDDPGSSVLTLTSLGMVLASRPIELFGKPHRRTIGLWRDVKNGVVEIDLPEGYDGALLTLHRHEAQRTTADGRTRTRFGAPLFGGLHFLKASDIR